MELTTSQKKAIEIETGPLLIIAGAGTGKTTVLVEKIKYLINKNLCKPEEILALTFTEKAAHEMEERIDKAMPYGIFQMTVTTFHSFCDQLLRNEIHHIGISPNYKLQTEAGIISFLKKNIFLFDLDYFRPLGNPNKFLEGLSQHFSRLKDENITPETYIKWAKENFEKTNKTEEELLEAKKNLELAKAYKKFQELKIKENIFDFSDLIYYVIQLFIKRKNILEKYKKQFKYILVDEFQDTNLSQYELIKMLKPPQENPNLIVIGDDNQSIYKFRGASISNIMQFLDEYPKANKAILTENYRSNQRILDCSYNLIKNNNPDTLESKLQISKNLISKTGKGEKEDVYFFSANTAIEEAEFICKKINELNKTYKFKDFAILIRSNSHLNLFTQTLNRHKIPFQFLGPNVLFKQNEIKDLIAYLKFLSDVSDSSAFYRILSMDIFNLDKIDLAKITSFTKNTNLTLYETIEVYLNYFYEDLKKPEYEKYKEHIFLVKKESKENLLKIYLLIKDSLNNLNKNTVSQILFSFLNNSGYLKKMMDFKNEKEEKIAINIAKFFDKLKVFENENEDNSTIAFIDFLEISFELNESPLIFNDDLSENNAVNILTVHSSKGLEFPVCFMSSLTADRFPTKEKKDTIPLPENIIKEILPSGNFHIQEERRLFYVGMTRAKDKLFLSYSKFYPENKREKKISPFIIEALGKEIIEKKEFQNLLVKKQLSIFDLKQEENINANESKKINYKADTFSYTQLDTFKKCPLRYKYQFIINIPTPPSASLIFGQTMHKTLQNFYKKFKENKNISLNELISDLKNNWVPLGYKSKKQEEKMILEGEKSLKNFFENFHSKNLNVLDLEKKFLIKINNINIKGIIDRVDKIENNEIEIIDYKTGKIPSDKDLKNNFQLTIYAIAASEKNIYNMPLDKITLSLIYLQENKKIIIKKNNKDILKTTEEIDNIVKEINNSDFKPKKSPNCSLCPFKINCEAWN